MSGVEQPGGTNAITAEDVALLDAVFPVVDDPERLSPTVPTHPLVMPEELLVPVQNVSNAAIATFMRNAMGARKAQNPYLLGDQEQQADLGTEWLRFFQQVPRTDGPHLAPPPPPQIWPDRLGDYVLRAFDEAVDAFERAARAPLVPKHLDVAEHYERLAKIARAWRQWLHWLPMT